MGPSSGSKYAAHGVGSRSAAVHKAVRLLRASDPVRGSEADKRRPAVIISNDGANATAARLGRGVLNVVPVTSNISRLYPFQVLLPAAVTGLKRDSKARAEQVRSVSIDRLGARIGELDAVLLADLDEALGLHLAL